MLRIENMTYIWKKVNPLSAYALGSRYQFSISGPYETFPLNYIVQLYNKQCETKLVQIFWYTMSQIFVSNYLNILLFKRSPMGYRKQLYFSFAWYNLRSNWFLR